MSPPDLPFVAWLVDTLDRSQTGPLLLLVPDLSFSVAVAALADPRCRGVVSRTTIVHDHARKILSEAGHVVLVCPSAPAAGSRVQVDQLGLLPLDSLAAQRSVICSSFKPETAALFRGWDVYDIGYLRMKFWLFDLLHQNPESMHDDDMVEAHLEKALTQVCADGWRRIRIVLSDPSSAELTDLGVPVIREPNPQIGCRGPRAAGKWGRELNAINRVARANPKTRFQVCVPFVSQLEEYQAARELVASTIDDPKLEIGFTLEIPSMWVDLPRVLRQCRPDFVVIGISDLFALLHGTDRSNPDLCVDDASPVNSQVLRSVFETCSEHDMHVAFGGNLNRYPEVRALIVPGRIELMSTTSPHSLALMARSAAGLARPSGGKDA